MENVFAKTARYYDKIYENKDYMSEVERLISLLGVDKGKKQLTLLDVACRTGLHITHLKRYFQVEGLDICPELLEIARINTSFVKDKISIFDLHHLIGTPKGTEHLFEHHEMGLFEIEEMMSVMEEAGLDVRYDPDGITGRCLYIGRRKELLNNQDNSKVGK